MEKEISNQILNVVIINNVFQPIHNSDLLEVKASW